MTENKNRQTWWMSAAFLILAFIFIFDVGAKKKVVLKNPLVPKEALVNETVRNPMTGPIIRQAGFKYNCNECHQHLQPPEVPRSLIAAHQNIIMEHGVNKNCYNCHHRTDREFLYDIDHGKIPITESARLCGKCHGARYNEWVIGIHGRQHGFWDQNKGEPAKVTCAACHNPHSPKFKPMKPLPGPIRQNFSTQKERKHD